MFGIIENIVNVSNHAKCVSLIIQKCEVQPSLVNLYPNEYDQELHYYPFTVKFDKCDRSCNTLNDLSTKVCAPKETKDLNVDVFNMITGKSK